MANIQLITNASALSYIEKDVDKAIESVLEFYDTTNSNIDSVIVQLQQVISDVKETCENQKYATAQPPNTNEIVTNGLRNMITTTQCVTKMKQSTKYYSDKHKDLHACISKIGKTADKCFQSDFGNVPIVDIFDTTDKLKYIHMIICEDLYRQGRISIAKKLIEETKLNDNELFNIEQTILEEINYILENIREKNLQPALDWCKRNREQLLKTNSLLEFHLHKMRFLQLLIEQNYDDAKMYMWNFSQYIQMNSECEKVVKELMGAFVFSQRDLSKSPYKYLLEPHLWLQLSDLFVKQAFQQMGLSQDSPLYVVMKTGFSALPALMSIVNAMQNTQVCHILSKDELPIEVDVGQDHRYHSVFACPILRQQTTDLNPPMKLVCGHVISRDALVKLTTQTKLKCPYCPMEQNLSDARRLFF
ncbi:unnamed protein product [Didymodactylos carnosus]|uniref:Uncharacterized protein n=1 Tax=Didymodactylos carnosus TaxID=1234261 RepID=A0A813XEV3_9BILA|nr:unnamed protein product [Didymodactylos carnosus]CAF0863790.1 unnamed protein product [Didymodactylos carnosus]CAF3530616.1 unnamed protein product [Didymodactylos carnosus]CAF3651342.1 unnamed protein product [Didymodactylos carnosus]